jgi:aspartyl/asparaginyl beta-hydroxylase (cupin superfamily)
MLARAVAADPRAIPLWMNLAKAQRGQHDAEGERESLLAALRIDQTDFMALIRLAELHQRLGEDAQASARWSAVLALAAHLPSRSAELEAVLAAARGFVDRHMRRFADIIEEQLASARTVADGRAKRRFDACLDRALGRRTIYHNICEGLHYPFLPADEFFDREHFPWLETLEAHTPRIRAQAEKLLHGAQPSLAPYVEQAPGTPPNKWTRLDRSTDWSVYYLWKYGERVEGCQTCPATAAALDVVPLADLPRRAPTAFFSVLQPHTRIPPHTGVSNTRAIVHLPLLVPPGCGFRVGREVREWREGEAFVFDDTIEHEAWNDSDTPRIILIFDVWNPYLDSTERDLVRAFYDAADASGFNPDARA